MPGATVLIHKLGDKLNFNLEEELRQVDIEDGWVKRENSRNQV